MTSIDGSCCRTSELMSNKSTHCGTTYFSFCILMTWISAINLHLKPMFTSKYVHAMYKTLKLLLVCIWCGRKTSVTKLVCFIVQFSIVSNSVCIIFYHYRFLKMNPIWAVLTSFQYYKQKAFPSFNQIVSLCIKYTL